MLYYINKYSNKNYNFEEANWLHKIKSQQPETIAIMHPDWRGIRSSTENLFDHCFYIGDKEDDYEKLDYYISLLLETNCKKIVLSGFPKTYTALANKLKKQKPEIKLYCLWHGSFMQSNEEYNWEQFKTILDMTQNGLFYKWGFVKEGMAEIMSKKFKIKTGFVKNYVKAIPKGAPEIDSTIKKIGIWAISPNWRKNPYAMLTASSLVENSKIFCFGHDSKVKDFINTFGINAHYQEEPINQSDMPIVLSQMHLNLYVTLSECTPMTPLESLSVGVPCLVGPTSHLFKNNDYLTQKLIVKYPDKASHIFNHIEMCLSERKEIIKSYIDFAKEYEIDAKLSVQNFLE